ncbi:MAG: 2Fe-2S iron-sulfur cluster binding domain-containing protein [Proteobacteria bacterium]|nr:2Fe-2S iron-sulfur cluster binding domain-containing protein [Pseudomonadota bacterium]
MHDHVPLTIADVHRETADAIVVSLALPPEHREAFRFRPGQHLALKATLGNEDVRRTYSICSGPDADTISIAIKRIAGGAFSNWANDTLAPGTQLWSMPPGGRFVLDDAPEAGAHFLAFAAGAGITPIIAMIEHALVLQPKSRFTLVYGNRDAEHIIFRERLEDLKDRHVGRFNLVHVLSRQAESDSPLLEGRITSEKVAAFAGHLFRVDDIDQVYLCGPGSMIRDVRNALFALGVSRERVHHEFFAAGGGAYRAVPAAAPVVPVSVHGVDVVAVLDGARRRFTAQPGEALIDAALRAGVRAPYSCKGGMCSTCRGRIVEGTVEMRVNYSLEPWELAQGFVLSCQAVPTSDRVVIDYDQM